jgi:hypothetical protein
MVTIDILDNTLVLEVQGWHKLWALKRRLDIPLAHIDRVYAEPSTTLGWWKGIRAPGTHIPGLIVAGTFYKAGKRIFWDVRNPKNTIVIDLKGGHYNQLIVEVQDPKTTVKEIRKALSALSYV